MKSLHAFLLKNHCIILIHFYKTLLYLKKIILKLKQSRSSMRKARDHLKINLIPDFAELNPLHTYFSSKICFLHWRNYADRRIQKLRKKGSFSDNSNDDRKKKESDSDYDQVNLDSETILNNVKSPTHAETLLIETLG